jgi:hypothetical protein
MPIIAPGMTQSQPDLRVKANERMPVGEDRIAPLSQATMGALRAWLQSTAWHTSHPDSEARFCDFVLALWRNDGKWSEEEVQGIIRKEVAFLAGSERLAGAEWIWRIVREKVILARILNNYLELAFP